MLLVNCRLRVFDLPQETHQQLQAAEAAAQTPSPAAATAADGSIPWQPAVQVHTGESIYDYCWFSGMAASDPASCCFASTSRVSDTLALTD
jgi:hypothetical protein